MTKKQCFFLVFCGLITSIFSQFASQVGIVGCTAIKSDSSIIVAWTTGCQVDRGYQNIASPKIRASFGSPSNALGKSDGPFGCVSLGYKGFAIVTYNRPIENSVRPDFTIFENGFISGVSGLAFLEIAFVEVSSDRKHFVRYPAVSNVLNTSQIGCFADTNCSLINNFAGKYIAEYGTPFDLEELKDEANLDVNIVRYINVIDVCGSISFLYASYDSKGNIINERYATPFTSSDFDFL